ncbi:DgyrCDS2584 [Dimorphilus gyrociliatus]|uniref:DgyrCDS2584 n=1 Tax=Dimorphilus gyrociliatus TaxID=2664684 RepID=A0A7I8VB54_9ANNE|nr:DgyrCDS2584 [Dimorphilus gyrociliatus]
MKDIALIQVMKTAIQYLVFNACSDLTLLYLSGDLDRCENDLKDHIIRNYYARHKHLSKNTTQCRVEYDSLNQALTKANYPFEELLNCTNAKCKIGDYQCKNVNYCVPVQYVCDKVVHCYWGDDEEDCGEINENLIHL